MSAGVRDMGAGVIYDERPEARRWTPGGLPGAAVRAGRLLELWGYRAARAEERAERLATPIRGREAIAYRVGGASSGMESRPRIY